MSKQAGSRTGGKEQANPPPPREPVHLGLVGSTGLVGRAVMQELIGREDFDLVALSRREISLPHGVRMQMRLAEPELWGEALAATRPEVMICALGTTWTKAGQDEEAFRAVDEKLVLQVAEAAKEAGAWHFIFVSSAGANPLGKTLYLQVKGEVEAALAKMRFKRLDILRPGIIRGIRHDDIRPAEGLGRLFSPLADLFLQGSNRRFRSISAATLARAILGLAREKAGGRFVHDHDSLKRAAHRFEEPLLR